MSLQTTSHVAHERAALADLLRQHLRYEMGNDVAPSRDDVFRALALATRQRMLDQLIATQARQSQADHKRVAYLSMEFLIGRSLSNNLHNLGLYSEARAATAAFGYDLGEIEEAEPDAALGNGGLGRLAACFLDSLATLGLPGFGYGLHYEFGLFRQEIRGGWQREKPDHWRGRSSPWAVERPRESVVVPLYGKVEHARDRDGHYNPMWLDWRVLIGVPYDFPIVGHGGGTVNTLRLFAARSSDEFDVESFNDGDYLKAVNSQIASESVSKILYPSDNSSQGRELRLVQEYFLVACAVRDMVRRYRERHASFDAFAEHFAIQLNDTHPALTVAELMRVLVDEQELEWERAFEITRAACGYTNHTLLPEALEKWPVEMLERVLPRHVQILYELNHRFLQVVAQRWPGDEARRARMSLVEEGPQRQFRMAHLAVVGSHSVNGVAKLHSQLLTSALMRDFHELWPERFSNKTNGVTHRRWLEQANPALAGFISEHIGTGWVREFAQIRGLERAADSPGSQADFLRIKRANKERLASFVRQRTGVAIDPASLFDVQIKRLHEYKRQLLNVMQVMHRYLALVDDNELPDVARTHVFAGKAAPGYAMAKLIIKLIHDVAEVVNGDPRTSGALRVVFVPDYKVSVAELIIPAAEVSEQISTAGFEASGTSNMKLAMNGALTLGTLDGANVEIAEEVGRENLYIFGLRADEVQRLSAPGAYRPREHYERSSALRRVVDSLVDGRFSRGDGELFRPIHDALLLHGDRYFHLADFDAYVATQTQIARDYAQASDWARKSILNVARTGLFSSDRTIQEYARDIWGVSAV